MRRLRWTMLVLAVLVTAAWPLSVVLYVRLSVGPASFCFGNGAISVGARPPSCPSFQICTDTWANGFFYGMQWDAYFTWSRHFLMSVPILWVWPSACMSAWALWRSHWETRGRARGLVGCCQDCGYDLTGNISGVCPECGGPADALLPGAIPRSEARRMRRTGLGFAAAGVPVAVVGFAVLPVRFSAIPVVGMAAAISGLLLVVQFRRKS